MRTLALKIAVGAAISVSWLACEASEVVISVGGEPDVLKVVSVDISSGTSIVLENLNLQVGDTAVLSATAFNVLDQALGGAPITWQSSSPGVASISSAGVVVALSPGTTTLSASAQDVTATVLTSVTDTTTSGPPPVAGQGRLTVSPQAFSLASVGATARLSVTAVDSLGGSISPPITWRSRSPSVASVNSSGLVTAVSLGSTVITVASACCSVDSSQVTVQQVPTGSSGLDWFCDWDFALGDDFLALLGQANGLDRRSGFGECFDEFTANARDTFMIVEPKTAAHGFPASITNVFRMVHDRNMSGSMMVQVDSGWTPPAVGQHLFLRTYDFNAASTGSTFNNHWLHLGNNNEGASDYQGIWRATGAVRSDGTYDNRWGAGVSSSPGSSGRGQGYFNNTQMKVGTLYRREVRMTRTDIDSVRVNLRVYNGAGTLVLTGADFKCATGGCASAGGFGADTLGQYKMKYTGTNGFHSLEIGNNGADSGDPATPQYWYVSGIAFRVSLNTNDWIGAYPVAGTGEGN